MIISLFYAKYNSLNIIAFCHRECVCVCMSIRECVSVGMFVRMSDSLTDHTKTVGNRPTKFIPIVDHTNCNLMTYFTTLNLMTLTFFLKVKYSNREDLGSGHVYLANG